MGKTKVMISDRGLCTLQTSGKYSCAVCRKSVGRTQSSVVDVHFGFTISVPISQVDSLKIPMLGVEGVLVMHRQLMEDLVLKSNLLMESLM